MKKLISLSLLLCLSASCAAPRALYRAPPEECRQLSQDRNRWGAFAAGGGVASGGMGGVGSLMESKDARVALAVSALVLAGFTAFAGTYSKGLADAYEGACTESVPEAPVPVPVPAPQQPTPAPAG